MTSRPVKFPGMPLKEFYTEADMRAYARQTVIADRAAIFARTPEMVEGSNYFIVYQLLKNEGPMTTTEVNIELHEMGADKVYVYLMNLLKRGLIVREKIKAHTLRGFKETYRWSIVNDEAS